MAPGELWVSYQKSDDSSGPGHHIVRSTMIGMPFVDRTFIDTATLRSGRWPDPAGTCSSSTQIV